MSKSAEDLAEDAGRIAADVDAYNDLPWGVGSLATAIALLAKAVAKLAAEAE